MNNAVTGIVKFSSEEQGKHENVFVPLKFTLTILPLKCSLYPLYLMARNNLPRVSCKECDQPTAWLCLECIYELGEPGTLCDQHTETHPHDDYGEPIPFVNSPRVGMCGYTGPAEPPY